MFDDTCFTCGKQTTAGSLYCSTDCQNLDASSPSLSPTSSTHPSPRIDLSAWSDLPPLIASLRLGPRRLSISSSSAASSSLMTTPDDQQDFASASENDADEEEDGDAAAAAPNPTSVETAGRGQLRMDSSVATIRSVLSPTSPNMHTYSQHHQAGVVPSGGVTTADAALYRPSLHYVRKPGLTNHTPPTYSKIHRRTTSNSTYASSDAAPSSPASSPPPPAFRSPVAASFGGRSNKGPTTPQKETGVVSIPSKRNRASLPAYFASLTPKTPATITPFTSHVHASANTRAVSPPLPSLLDSASRMTAAAGPAMAGVPVHHTMRMRHDSPSRTGGVDTTPRGRFQRRREAQEVIDLSDSRSPHSRTRNPHHHHHPSTTMMHHGRRPSHGDEDDAPLVERGRTVRRNSSPVQRPAVLGLLNEGGGDWYNKMVFNGHNQHHRYGQLVPSAVDGAASDGAAVAVRGREFR